MRVFPRRPTLAVEQSASFRRLLGVSLLEILVAVAIVAIVVCIALPTLAKARKSTHRVLCANNLRQIAGIGRLYAADHHLYLGQASALDYQSSAHPHNGQPLPGVLAQMGFTHTQTRQPDHYLAHRYMPLGTTPRGQAGSHLLLCPTLQDQQPHLSDRHWEGAGNVESHYFFSTLLNAPTGRSNLKQVRNNIWGPYRSDRIKHPDRTILAGDALVMTPADAPAATVDIFNHTSVGKASTLFGVSNQPSQHWEKQSDPYHAGGPNALHYDGHVATIEPPPADNRYRVRPHLTADATDQHR